MLLGGVCVSIGLALGAWAGEHATAASPSLDLPDCDTSATGRGGGVRWVVGGWSVEGKGGEVRRVERDGVCRVEVKATKGGRPQ